MEFTCGDGYDAKIMQIAKVDKRDRVILAWEIFFQIVLNDVS